MRESKTYLGAFLVGGIYAAIGQAIFMAFTAILGADSPFIMGCTLVGMGVVALAMYIPGFHQRVSAWSGWGSILPFNGFACAVADNYEAGAREGGAKGGLLRVADLVLWVIGVGAMISIVIGIAAFFMA